MFVQKYSAALKKENLALKTRKLKIKNHIQKHLKINRAKNKIPTIAICCSGGGFRSMLSTAGFLCIAQKNNLLKVTSYITTISGSSWFLIPWILSDNKINNFTNELILKLDEIYNFKQLKNLSIKKLKNTKNYLLETYLAFLKIKKIKKESNQNVSLVDLYGILLSSFLLSEFKEKKFDLKLSDLTKKINSGNYPFPMFLATSQLNNYKYQWLEFSPYYIASSYLNSSISPWLLGATFYNGKSKNNISELPLGVLMGIFGSAFSTNIKDAIHRAINISSLKEIKHILQKTETSIFNQNWANKKIFPAQITNFTFGMPNSPIKDLNTIEVVDGGYSCNLPIQPLLHPQRNIDIIIVLDNTNQKFSSSAFSLREAETQAREANLKFPPVDYKKAQNQSYSVFEDKSDPKCPIIIYIPLKKDLSYSKDFDPHEKKYCNTTNFFYSSQQAQNLVGLTKHIATKYQNDIWEVIKNKI
ncbi:hypothetical protein ACFLYH_03330 [Candidatus Dependentiae bacterium]